MRFPIGPVSRRARARSLAAAAAVLPVPASVNSRSLARWSRGAAALVSGLKPSSAFPDFNGASTGAQVVPRRWQSSGGSDGLDRGLMNDDFAPADSTGLQSELVRELEGEGNLSIDAALSQPLGKADLLTPTARIRLEKIERPPARFDMLTNSLVYRWQTTAGQARKVTGPMREWASELKYRTGVHLEVEPTYPERAAATTEAEGGYATADEVELSVYLFGSERGIFNCRQLMEAALDQDPAYVRLGVFRRKPGKSAASGHANSSSISSSSTHHTTGEGSTSSSGDGKKDGGSGSKPSTSAAATLNPNDDIEWLMLRRINRDLRPPDIPPISLKLPGKWTLLFEHYKEAAVRTLWEETGITVDPNNVYPTGRLHQENPAFYWRVPVYYFVAEVPYDVEVLGPQVGLNTYMHHWDAQLLRQSPDPIDRAWAQLANPETGCAWMKVPMIDELQRPLRGENYMATRYTPPPYSGLNNVLGFAAPTEAETATGATEAADEAPVASAEAVPATDTSTPAEAAEKKPAVADENASADAPKPESTPSS